MVTKWNVEIVCDGQKNTNRAMESGGMWQSVTSRPQVAGSKVQTLGDGDGRLVGVRTWKGSLFDTWQPLHTGIQCQTTMTPLQTATSSSWHLFPLYYLCSHSLHAFYSTLCSSVVWKGPTLIPWGTMDLPSSTSFGKANLISGLQACLWACSHHQW